jgi:hypothetical protein
MHNTLIGMKNLFLTLALVLVSSVGFASTKNSEMSTEANFIMNLEVTNPEPLIIATTCGKSFVVDGAGMTFDQIVQLSEALDFIACELPKRLTAA